MSKSNIKTDEARESCSSYYNKIAEEYFSDYQDELNRKPYDKAFLDRFLAILPAGSHILDVGCSSTAQQARYFAALGHTVISIDLSEKCIEKASKSFPGIDFQQMNMTCLTFADESFEAINAFYSIIHIPDEELETLFKGFQRVLKDKGKLAISVHAGDFYGMYEETEIPVFYRTYTKEGLIELLQTHGFQLIEIEQRKPIYDFEFQSERIYLIAEKRCQ